MESGAGGPFNHDPQSEGSVFGRDLQQVYPDGIDGRPCELDSGQGIVLELGDQDVCHCDKIKEKFCGILSL